MHIGATSSQKVDYCSPHILVNIIIIIITTVNTITIPRWAWLPVLHSSFLERTSLTT